MESNDSVKLRHTLKHLESVLPLPFVDELIQLYESGNEFSELFMVGDAISAAAQGRKLTASERLEVGADVAALTFHASTWEKSCWGTYFAPRSSDTQPNGDI